MCLQESFTIMLDDHPYSQKPDTTEVGGIVNRLLESPTELTIDELIQRIEQGKTVLPALFRHAHNGQIRKQKEYWSNQQLIFLDFDNETEVPDPLPDKPNNKKKIKDVRMTYEEATEHFKDKATFVYKSFSCTDNHPKFRVVIALDRVIHSRSIIERIFSQFKKLYPYIDSKCLEQSRIFFGGYDVHKLNPNNRLNVDEMLDNNEGDILGVHNNLSCIDINVPLPNPSHKSINSNHTYISNNNIQHIISNNIQQLQSAVNPNPTSLSKSELYEQLYRIDFSNLLGVNNKHPCLYHNDTNASAHIKVRESTGHYVYHCFGCGFTGNIITCIEKLFADRNVKIKRGVVIEMLRRIYMIDIELTEWGKQQKQELESNISLLLSNEIAELEPDLYKLIVKSIPNLIALHYLAIDGIASEDFTDKDGNVLFRKDLRSLTAALGKGSKDKVAKEINFYTYLGMINKINPVDLPKDLKIKVAQHQFNNKYKYKENFYSFPSYTYGVRKFAEQKAVEWKQKGYLKTALTREMLFRGHGEEEANRVYPQMNGEKFADINEETASELIRIGLLLIQQKGWTTEKEIENNLHLYWKGQGRYKSNMMKTIRAEFLESYGLVKKSLNKELADRLGIEIPLNANGNPCYPTIIYKAE